MSAGFTKMATVTASTKRSPAVSGGKRGAATENIASLKCTPLDPVTAEVAERFGLQTPHERLTCFTEGDLDILEGDILVVSSVDYPIKAVGEWTWPRSTTEYKQLILEQLKV